MAVQNKTTPEDNITYDKSNEAVIDIAPDVIEVVKGGDIEVDDITNITKPFQSPNFKSGVSGWRLNSNGVIQAVGVEIAGDLDIEGVVQVVQGGTGAVTLTGILLGNGTSAVTAITPLSGTKTYYVADSSGGAVTRKLTFTNGILTSET